jgi:hypothetical protein
VYTFDENTSAYAVLPEDTFGWKEGAPKTTVTPVPPGATEVTFDGLGRIIPNGFPVADGTLTIQQINVTNTNVSSPRRLRVAISTPDVTGTKPGTKLCDPDPRVALNDPNDPRICPP